MVPADIPLDHQLCFSLYSASMAIGRAYKPLLDALEITYPQYLVLSTLWEGGAQSVGGIADRLALESSTVTPLVKRLEQAGFVARKRNWTMSGRSSSASLPKAWVCAKKIPLPWRDVVRRSRHDAGTADRPEQRGPCLSRCRGQLHRQNRCDRGGERRLTWMTHDRAPANLS